MPRSPTLTLGHPNSPATHQPPPIWVNNAGRVAVFAGNTRRPRRLTGAFACFGLIHPVLNLPVSLSCRRGSVPRPPSWLLAASAQSERQSSNSATPGLVLWLWGPRWRGRASRGLDLVLPVTSQFQGGSPA